MDESAKILIVDDREENLLALEAVLRLPNVSVVKATSGEMALELLLEHDIALVILDVQMPGMDGFETAELMRGNKRTREIPIIFVTGISKEDSYLFKGYESGAVDYLCKPLKVEILLGKVRYFVEKYFQRKELVEKTEALDCKIKELEQVKEELEQANRRLEMLSIHDALTDLYNRRGFDTKAEEEFQRCRRNNRPMALLMIDIDFFKRYNDHYGHQQGDRCLILVAGALANLVNRPGDLLVRYGGEEFLVMLPETDLLGASHMASSICRTISNLQIEHLESEIAEYLTVSVGAVAVQPDKFCLLQEIVQGADEALYEAKKKGRNCSVVRDYSCELS